MLYMLVLFGSHTGVCCPALAVGPGAGLKRGAAFTSLFLPAPPCVWPLPATAYTIQSHSELLFQLPGELERLFLVYLSGHAACDLASQMSSLW